MKRLDLKKERIRVLNANELIAVDGRAQNQDSRVFRYMPLPTGSVPTDTNTFKQTQCNQHTCGEQFTCNGNQSC